MLMMQNQFGTRRVEYDPAGNPHVIHDIDHDLFFWFGHAIPYERVGEMSAAFADLQHVKKEAPYRLPRKMAETVIRCMDDQMTKIKMVVTSQNSQSIRDGREIDTMQDKLTNRTQTHIYKEDEKAANGILNWFSGRSQQQHQV